MPYLGPDTVKMSLREVLAYRKQKQELTQKYDKGLVPFERVFDERIRCDSCNDRAYWTRTYTDMHGNQIPPQLIPVELTDWDGAKLCRKCFRAYWCVLPHEGGNHPGYGSNVSGFPRSQRDYDGDNFGSGEW